MGGALYQLSYAGLVAEEGVEPPIDQLMRLSSYRYKHSASMLAAILTTFALTIGTVKRVPTLLLRYLKLTTGKASG